MTPAAEASFFDGDHCQHVADRDEDARLRRIHAQSLEALRLLSRSPMRSRYAQHDAAHLPLFVAGNEPGLL